MRAPTKSFAAAVAEFQRTAGLKMSMLLTEDDLKFLGRLRTATIKSSHHFDDDVRLVANAVRALRIAKVRLKLPDADRRHKEAVDKVTDAVQVLRNHFKLGRPDFGDGARALKRGLAWVDELYGGVLGEISDELLDIAPDLPDDRPLTRLSREASEQNLFMAEMSNTMQDIFGEFRDGDVAHLNDIAFETNKTTTTDQVRGVRRSTGQLTKK